jgi:hypothetical protein
MIQISIFLTLENFIEIGKVFIVWKVFSECLSYFKLNKIDGVAVSDITEDFNRLNNLYNRAHVIYKC